VTFLKTATLAMNESTIASYCDHLTKEGCGSGTVGQYQRRLRKLYEFLPVDKLLNEDAAAQWMTHLTAAGYSKTTISANRSIVNGFLEFFARAPQKDAAPSSPQSALTREQYLRLLLRAKREGRKRAYLLIKTIVTAGIRSCELEELTVETLQKGESRSKAAHRQISVPEPVRSELLDYAREEHISSGPVFITNNGTPLLHSAIWKEIKRISRAEGLAEEAGSPRQLYLVHADTCGDIRRNKSSADADAAYRQLLCDEERQIGWNT